MSMQMALDLQKEIRALPGNKYCADCGTLNPQWASLSMGSLVCLNCSGQHRSLGVHLSFVRSVTMDSWSEKQIRAMRAGGNKKMNEFLSANGVPKMNANQIREKYDNPVAEYYREIIEAKRDGTAGPSGPVPQYGGGGAGAAASGSKSSASQDTAAGGDDFEGLSAEERYARHKKLEAEARERMRAKFGTSGGLGSGSFGSAGLGSDPNYRPGGSSGGGGGGGGGASDWFSQAAKATSQWGSKVNEDLKKAKVGDKLKSGWSWFTQSATNVIEKAKANIAKDDEPPKLYSRGDSPRGSPPRLYNPQAAQEVSSQSSAKSMTGFGSGASSASTSSTSSTSGKKLQGFGSSSVTASAAAPKAASSPSKNSSTIGWDDDLFGDEDDLDMDTPTNATSTASTGNNVAEMDDDTLLGDIDNVLGDAAAAASSQPTPAPVESVTAKVEQLDIKDEDDDDFFKEFGM